jgi:hypothetical protein
MKRIAFLSAIILLLIIGVTVYYQYNQPRKDVSTQHTDVAIAASLLYRQYFEHEKEANLKYLDKIIEVKGMVSEVQNNNGMMIVLMNAEDGLGGINCSMKEPNLHITQSSLRDKTVIIKGKCTGFLIDVNLVDCVLVQPENN